MQFDYFYPEQADQYAFYRIPRRLFTDSNFKELTTEAKILYGLMLDRVSLSLKNMWIDKNRRVYIIFTLKEVCLENLEPFIDEVLPEKETIDLCDVDCMDLVASELIE
ncbi:hypothetical protein JCM17039_07680 [Blautia glucerasea]